MQSSVERATSIGSYIENHSSRKFNLQVVDFQHALMAIISSLSVLLPITSITSYQQDARQIFDTTIASATIPNISRAQQLDALAIAASVYLLCYKPRIIRGVTFQPYSVSRWLCSPHVAMRSSAGIPSPSLLSISVHPLHHRLLCSSSTSQETQSTAPRPTSDTSM